MTPPPNSAETQVAILEVKVDGRISSMENTFANFVKLMDERQKVSEARFERIETMLAEMRGSIANLRTTIIVTGITSVLAATFGIAALNASMQSNIFEALSYGKEMSEMQSENKRQAEAIGALIKQLQKDADKKK
jgi:uncharacterized membrane protein (DUF4010 family)